jgi:para-aminobenzoate synthetase component 1
MTIAKLYKKRDSILKKGGLNVGIYLKYRETPIANYKTLNYLYYYLAGIWAINHGFDEAIILNYDGSISEGNSSNIFLVYGKKVIIPKSNFVLSGVMLDEAIKQFKKNKYTILKRLIYPTELFVADAVFLTNSLMGIVPVFSVNNKTINSKLEILKNLNLEVFY